MSNIFKTLNAINVNDDKEKKGKFDYLPWTDAWTILMAHYPNATHDMLEDVHYADGSMEVRSSVTINGQTLKMFLPVINHQNKAIQNPNAFDINKNRMRCLAKNIALFGLGLYLFRGEDLPAKADPFTPEQKTQFLALLAGGDGFALKRFAHVVGNEVMTELFNAAPQGQKTKQKEMVRGFVNEANASLKVALAAIQEAINDGSYSTIEEIYGEMEQDEAFFVENGLSEIQNHAINTLREAA